MLIEDFTYDGNGPDAFFYVGTEGAETHAFLGEAGHQVVWDSKSKKGKHDQCTLAGSPGPRGLVLAHPFEGKYYDYRDPRVRYKYKHDYNK